MNAFLFFTVISASYEAQVMEQKTGLLKFVVRHDEQLQDGQMNERDTYLYPTLADAKADGFDDREASVEEAVSSNGELQLYTLEQHQQKQHGTIEVDNAVVYYTWLSPGRRQIGLSQMSSSFAVPTTIATLAMHHWSALVAYQKVTARIGIVEERSDFGLVLRRVDSAAPGEIKIGVKPSSFVIALFAPDIYLRFGASDGKLRGYHGPVSVAKRVGTKWQTLFVDLVVNGN